jgi:bacillopeptidase F (M6 metalloprotease family)
MTLTHTFDFTGQSGPLTLSYRTWYDIEEDWDFVYLEASTDGENWQMISTPSGTAQDPTGNNYGWGYTGLSGGGPQWIEEQVDLSNYAGQEVKIRFEYITDAAVNGEGLLLDDISIPEIGYFSDFETDDGGWEADGWVRIQNVLPQTFGVSLIKSGDSTTVEEVQLLADNTAEIPLEFGNGVDEITLVVSGTTRFTRQPAAYRFDFAP